MLMYPKADIPIVAVSLVRSYKINMKGKKELYYDPDFHFRLGQALGPLREEGVLILGSGFTWHNLSEIWGLMNSIKPHEPS